MRCLTNDQFVTIRVISSHDGTSIYQLRIGVFRVVSPNGLIVSQWVLPAYRVSHRGDVLDNEVISGALEVSERFGCLEAQVERMEHWLMPQAKQIRFAEWALAIPFPEAAEHGVHPSLPRRLPPTGAGRRR